VQNAPAIVRRLEGVEGATWFSGCTADDEFCSAKDG